MAEWLVEEGIGEHRALLLEGGRIEAARLHWPGTLTAGQVEDARLITRRAGTSRGLVRFGSGEEALADALPKTATEGSKLRCIVVRSALREQGRVKAAQVRPTNLETRAAPTLLEQLRDEGQPARLVRRFPEDADWNGLWTEVRGREVEFPGGRLLFHPTPAMTLIDVDGDGRAADLAGRAVTPLARALRQMDVGGNIGIDFPTLTAREERRRIDAALAAALLAWPHERTAMNGFGFVQIVARQTRPSLLALLTFQPAAALARRVLRDAELLSGSGDILLACSDAVEGALKGEWLAELSRRTGRAVRVGSAPSGLDRHHAHAQLVPRD
ncbi:ribonuclease [Erythrobacteraceae bacterium CFH 75059]|uniref:ribonuclease n=1 Tax=Qipengyuania thermophila TaxID=2509361 RepID=UPI0010212C19|nr:ribonuclease [Qipengyuania thermophila]TCD04917.1 ribonuclease [Erythrobacteraceae bacterium CFH 75059]